MACPSLCYKRTPGSLVRRLLIAITQWLATRLSRPTIEHLNTSPLIHATTNTSHPINTVLNTPINFYQHALTHCSTIAHTLLIHPYLRWCWIELLHGCRGRCSRLQSLIFDSARDEASIRLRSRVGIRVRIRFPRHLNQFGCRRCFCDFFRFLYWG